MARQRSEPELPAAVETERFILGLVLRDSTRFPDVTALLKANDFTTLRHQRIFARMLDLDGRGEKIDGVTVFGELKRHKETEPDTLSYISSLDDGLPVVPNCESYCRILKEKSARRRVAAIGRHAMNLALTGEDDIAEVARRASAALDDATADGRDDDGMTAEEMVAACGGGVNAFLDPSRNPPGIPTGFRRLDEMTGGMKPGELIVIGARPSVGKTTLASNIAWHAAVNSNVPVEFFSMEMSREKIVKRLLSQATRVAGFKLRYGGMEPEERRVIREAFTRLMDSKLRFHERGGVFARTVRAAVRRRKAKLAVVDYLQLMTAEGRFDNRNAEISHITRAFKILAEEEGIPVILLSQLRRPPNTGGARKPELSDLRDSGSIESDADVVMLIDREVIGKKARGGNNPKDGSQAEVILAKQRDGPVGPIPMRFTGSCVLFEEVETIE